MVDKGRNKVRAIRTYWKIIIVYRKFNEKVYFWTDKPIPPRQIPNQAVLEKMMLNVDLRYVQQVKRLTKEEYLQHMNE